MNASNHFSVKTINALLKKGVSIIRPIAVPAFEGDQYFSGTAYELDANGQSIIRTHSQIRTMAVSSWMPDDPDDPRQEWD